MIEKKRLIVVLGMHRSGTSAITRALSVLGVELGDTLLPPVPGDNDKGYFEDIDLESLNVEMMQALGSDWSHVAPVEFGNTDNLHKLGYFPRAVALLRQKTASTPIFGFKDPRVAKLLPFWRQVFAYCGFEVGYVLVIRNPLSVAQSLAKRAPFSAEQSHLLWLGHVLYSLIHTHAEQRVLVDYDQFLGDLITGIERIASRLALLVQPQALNQYQTEFLDLQLRHTVYDENDLALDIACPPLVQEIYFDLLGVARDNTQLDNKVFQSRTTQWAKEFDRLKSNLIWIDQLLTQNTLLAQQIAGHGNAIKDLVRTALKQDRNILQTSFDVEWYLQNNPDVADAGVDPYQHYVDHGFSEGRPLSSELIAIIRHAWLRGSKDLKTQLDQAQSIVEAHRTDRTNRENLFTTQLQEIMREHELQNVAQSSRHTEREQMLEVQISQARAQIESHLLNMAAREKVFSDQLLLMQHAQEKSRLEYDQSIATREIVREQIHHTQLTKAQQQIESYQLRLIEREKNLSEQSQALHAQLCTKQDELYSQAVRWAETEKKYMNVIGELHNELNNLRSTRSWRWTAFFRKLIAKTLEQGSTYGGQSISPVITETLENASGMNQPYLHSPMNKNNNMATTSLEELLSYDDVQFVHAAYLTVLGRVPDPEGMHYYLARVRAGIHKLEILGQLRMSKEGRAKPPTMAALERAIKWHRRLKNPFLGTLMRPFAGGHSVDDSQQKLRAIDNKLYLIDSKLQHWMGEMKSSLDQIHQLIGSRSLIATSAGWEPSNTHAGGDVALVPQKSKEIDHFDASWYLEQYPDVLKSGLDPYEHYLLRGKSEGRHPAFDPVWYLKEYQDVAACGMDPRLHYSMSGKGEGRHPAFNRDWYLSQYPDVAEAGTDPVEHYFQFGKAEGRYPAFDRDWYLNQYLDVQSAGIDPLFHYLNHGKAEGRYPVRCAESTRNNYSAWVRLFDTLDDKARRALQNQVAQFKQMPLISVVMPVYNPNPAWLIEAIESVRNQIYPNWELCIADDLSPDKAIRPILEKYMEDDSRIKVVFRTKNGHISNASNSALEIAKGEWVALLDHDDLLPEHALFWVVDAINKYPDIRLIYSDEDKIYEHGGRAGAYFKSDWNPDLFYSHNMFSHLGVYSAELIHRVGGFRIGLEGSQDYDLALRCIELIDAKQIHHVPKVLYHWRVHAQSTAQSSDAKPYAMIAGARAINEHFKRQNLNATAELIAHGYRVHYQLPKILPLVTLIVPTRNGLHLIKQCIQSILEKTSYKNYEIIVVDNGSDDPNTLQYLEEISRKHAVRVVRDDRTFNFSALNNQAVKLARGEVIGLLNNDIEVISPDWLSEMVSHALRPEVGAVGAKLLYPDDTIQHGGILLGVGGIAAHSHKHLARGNPGYLGRANLIQSFSAVTAACLVIKKSIYEALGGLNDRDLQVSYNDVDFCLRVRAAGYRNIWTPYAELYHHESATRGPDETPEKQMRYQKEINYMKNNWQDMLDNDPAYNPNLTVHDEDYSLAWPPRGEGFSSK